jgi:hypothetical protein
MDRTSSELGPATRILRKILLYARDFGWEVKDAAISSVYDSCEFLRRGVADGNFAQIQTLVLMEAMPFEGGSLRYKRRKPFRARDSGLLIHGADVAGEIAYSVCKYVREKTIAEDAIYMLYAVLRLAVLNQLRSLEVKVNEDFEMCKRISAEEIRGKGFNDGLELLSHWREAAYAG